MTLAAVQVSVTCTLPKAAALGLPGAVWEQTALGVAEASVL